MERLRGKRVLGRLSYDASVIKSRAPGGPGYSIVRTAVPDIAESLVRSLLNVTVLALRILRYLLDFLWMEVAQDRGKYRRLLSVAAIRLTR